LFGIPRTKLGSGKLSAKFLRDYFFELAAFEK
jgi:hypothetical protein